MAREIKDKIEDLADYEKVLDSAIAAPKQYFSEITCRKIRSTEQNTYAGLTASLIRAYMGSTHRTNNLVKDAEGFF